MQIRNCGGVAMELLQSSFQKRRLCQMNVEWCTPSNFLKTRCEKCVEKRCENRVKSFALKNVGETQRNVSEKPRLNVGENRVKSFDLKNVAETVPKSSSNIAPVRSQNDAISTVRSGVPILPKSKLSTRNPMAWATLLIASNHRC